MIVSRSLQLAGLILLAGFLAQGQVIVFGNLASPDHVHGAQIFASPLGPQTVAAQFTPAGNFNLVDAQVMISTLPSGGPTFNVFIAADSGGVPGAFIQQIGFGVTATSSNGSVVTANSISTPIPLTNGTKYWLVLAPATSTTGVFWDGSATSSVPLTYNSSPTFNSGWAAPVSSAIQFQIDGTPVGPQPTPTPLPTSVILALTGLASVGLYQMRRRRLRS